MSETANECPVDIQPYDVADQLRNPRSFNFNYTNQDFWSMKKRCVDFLLEKFGPNGSQLPNTFNDLVESSVAIMLIENWAFLADTLSFKMDQIVNEVFIDTVTEVENAFRLSKLVGFKPQPPIASSSMWVATINSPVLTDISIPTPYPIDLSGGDVLMSIELFQADANNNPLFDQDIVIPAGSTSNQSIIGLEGRTRSEVLIGTGQVAQTFRLAFFPVIYDSISVNVDGVGWQQVEFFTDSQPRREYRVEFDSKYNAFIIFGNNRSGLIPGSGSSIQVTYRVGGGTRGNIVTGFADTQIQQAVQGLLYPVPITIRNYTRGQYGYDGDTIEDVRRKLPRWIKTQNRAVSGEDYKTLADQLSTPYHGQVGKSTAVLRNHGCAGNIVDLYILARNGEDGLQLASNELKVEVNDEMNDRKMITDFLCIRDGTIILTDILVDVTINKFYRKFELELRTNIFNKIKRFFSINNWEFGQTLKDTDIVKEIGDIKEIEDINIRFVTDDPDNSGTAVVAKFYEIIRPDETTITFLYS